MAEGVWRPTKAEGFLDEAVILEDATMNSAKSTRPEFSGGTDGKAFLHLEA